MIHIINAIMIVSAAFSSVLMILVVYGRVRGMLFSRYPDILYFVSVNYVLLVMIEFSALHSVVISTVYIIALHLLSRFSIFISDNY